MKMPSRLLRIYVDTSVIGGCLDEEFAKESKRLIDSVYDKRVTMLLSDVVVREIHKAKAEVQEILDSISKDSIEVIALTKEVIELRDAYMKAGILGPRWIDDATLVACASVARADAIVSWNFKHIVRLEKMKAYNQVNFSYGYATLTIITPKEVGLYEK